MSHFVGLHALQVLTVGGWLLSRRMIVSGRLDHQRAILMHIAGIAFSAWLGLLTWQALRGQSIVTPDGLTLVAYGAIIAFIAGGITFVLGKSSFPQPPAMAAHVDV